MWLYQGQEFNAESLGRLQTDQAKSYFGFIYIITNTATNKRYIGKKFFSKAKTYKRKGRTKKSRVGSDWENYWGSSEALHEDINRLGRAKFRRDIIMLCETRGDTNYYEAKFQFQYEVLENPELWYNGQIRIRATSIHLSCNKKK